jgi:hypothetical protein
LPAVYPSDAPSSNRLTLSKQVPKARHFTDPAPTGETGAYRADRSGELDDSVQSET